MFWILPMVMGFVQLYGCLSWLLSDKTGAAVTACSFGVFALVFFGLAYQIHEENR